MEVRYVSESWTKKLLKEYLGSLENDNNNNNNNNNKTLISK